MTNPFDDATETPVNEVEETDIAVMEPEDLDVDIPTDVEDGTDEIDAPVAAEGKPAKEKEPKAPARPPVPEGFITPVAGAKLLTAHLAAKGEKDSKGVLYSTDNPITSQMVYSYVRNSQKPNGKYPLQYYTEGGRENLLKPQELLDWWDAKIERVTASKANAAAKKAKQAEKATASPQGEVESGEAGEGFKGEVTEAE